ncbi:unnamed protein product, partial [Protopolystoma xenopodis]
MRTPSWSMLPLGSSNSSGFPLSVVTSPPLGGGYLIPFPEASCDGDKTQNSVCLDLPDGPHGSLALPVDSNIMGPEKFSASSRQ